MEVCVGCISAFVSDFERVRAFNPDTLETSPRFAGAGYGHASFGTPRAALLLASKVSGAKWVDLPIRPSWLTPSKQPMRRGRPVA